MERGRTVALEADDRGDRTQAQPAAAEQLVHAVTAAALGDVEVTDTAHGPAARLRPRGVGEVAQAVSLVARVGGHVAVTQRVRPGLLALDLGALSEVETPDETSCLVRVGAGASVRQVEARAIQAGLSLGPLLPSTQFKTVGAWLSGPTRGERSIPTERLETAALALEAVLADGSRYRSREAPRSATGPDLDYLLLGGEGRFGIVTKATLRLFPRGLVEAAGSRPAVSAVEAVQAVRAATLEGLSPAEARWERGRGVVEARFTGNGAAARARRFGERPLGGRELRGHLELAGSWKAWAAISPLRAEAVQLVAIHTDGAFGALVFDDPEEAERAATAARAIGFAVVSPRRLRASPETGWRHAGTLLELLAKSLDPKGVFAR